MPRKKVYLVTGAAGEWGKRVASQLILQQGAHVIGLDREKPGKEIRGLDFIQADMRDPLISDLLKSEKVDTICHLAFMETRQPSENAFDVNVIGAMKLLAACSRSGVKKVVIKSSIAAYGAQAMNSSFLTETHPLNGSREVGILRDLMEIEAFCSDFQRKYPEIILTILRFPNIIGPTVNTTMVRYLKEPIVPVLLGFDPRMQIIHENDVTRAIVKAALQDFPGTFNVAAEGILPLLRVVALAGKMPLPVIHLLAYWGKSLLSGADSQAFASIPYDLDSLRYDCIGDLTKMRNEFGFTPAQTAEETLREFAAYLRLSPYKSADDDLKRDEENLREQLERRRQEAVKRRSRNDEYPGGDENSSPDKDASYTADLSEGEEGA
jgi:UDP-glucose 4-epimerase